jgi:transposase
MAIMPKRYPKEQRDRAVRLVLDHLDEYDTPFLACKAIAPRVGVGVESLRRWVQQALVDTDAQPGVKTVERQRIRDLERENRELKEANEILKSASIFFARALDPHHR